MEREACVCDHGFERSDLFAEIMVIIIYDRLFWLSQEGKPKEKIEEMAIQIMVQYSTVQYSTAYSIVLIHI